MHLLFSAFIFVMFDSSCCVKLFRQSVVQPGCLYKTPMTIFSVVSIHMFSTSSLCPLMVLFFITRSCLSDKLIDSLYFSATPPLNFSGVF